MNATDKMKFSKEEEKLIINKKYCITGKIG